MTRPIEIKPGDRFGRWTVISFAGSKSKYGNKKQRFYLCRCDCGTVEEVANGGLLKKNKEPRCNKCGRRFLDLAGKLFGMLQVVERTERPADSPCLSIHWRCVCDCGKEVVRSAEYLTITAHPTCGCKRWKEAKDLTGKTFGQWTVIAIAKKGQNETGKYELKWKCRCECGRTGEVDHWNLTANRTSGCKRCAMESQLQKRRSLAENPSELSHLIGATFHRLTIAEIAEIKLSGCYIAICRCECGSVVKVHQIDLEEGRRKSCGCLRDSLLGDSRRTHGQCATRDYRIWRAMIQRCTNPNNPSFESYGGRGITICDQWRTSFETFIADMGASPSVFHSLDRIDVNRNYEPSNCRWATRKEQGRNKSTSKMIEYCGQTKCLAEWCEEFDLPYNTIAERIKRGWNSVRALETPIKSKGFSRKLGTEKTIWQNIKYRCHHPNCPSYPRYGGRGIRMCDRWRESFEAFLADMGSRPSVYHSVDRIDVNGNYCPENCRWATPKEQANNKSNNLRIEFRGETKTLSEWADQCGISAVVLRMRLKAGWPTKEAMTIPLKKSRPGIRRGRQPLGSDSSSQA